MTRLDFDPDLERLGDALRASTAIDLAREQRAARPASAGRPRRKRLRPRILAGSTLGLAGVAAALVLALGGTAATAPAFAITRASDGSVLVHLNTNSSSFRRSTPSSPPWGPTSRSGSRWRPARRPPAAR